MDLDDVATAEPIDEGGEAVPVLAAPPHLMMPDPNQMAKLTRWSDPVQTINICDELLRKPDGESLLGRIGQEAFRQYQIDQGSRSEWMEKSKAAMDLAMQVTKAKTFPWANASNVIYPILSETAIQFAARAYPAIVSDRGVVKGVVYGNDEGIPRTDPMSGQPIVDQKGQPVWLQPPGALRARADRIADHMSWQYLEEMSEWEEETDKLLHILPIVGCCFRKSLYDDVLRRTLDLLVLAENCVINFSAKSMETAPRITEEQRLYPGEVEEAIRAGTFLKHEFGPAQTNDGDEDAPHDFLEQHRTLDLDEDGYAEPYIVTLHKATNKVTRIVGRYDGDGIHVSGRTGQVVKIDPVHYYTKYDFFPNAQGGIYGTGFGQLLKPLNESVNSALNQIFDAGTLQNTGGGFIGRGLSMHSGATARKLGEWTPINVPGAKIREAIVPIEHRGPSETLFKLLGFLVEAAEKLGSNAEVLSGNQRSSNVPATTTLALIEQGMKVFTGVYKRYYRSATKSADKQYRLNRLYLDPTSHYRKGEEWKQISRQDYEAGSRVQPVSDPSMVSDMQELAKAELLKEFRQDPYIDQKEVRRRILQAAHVSDVETLLVKELPPDPMLLIKAEELKIKELQARAAAVASLAGAVKQLADAGRQGAETQFRWIEMQMQAVQQDVEAMANAGTGQGPAGQGAGAPGGAEGGLQPLEARPGNPSLSGVPAGQV